MARWKSRTLTEGELDFMQVLWKAGEATPEVIQEMLYADGRSLTGGTIRNVLAVMMEKGFVTRRKLRKTHLYRAKVDEDQALKDLAQDLLVTAFKGSESLMIGALLKNRDISPEKLEDIERMIADRKGRDKR